ncbi:helix-hairpin-helix domain-containing protein [Clostridium lundense]|uniref:helix-hairpin-helix domain-containing protein n=1 Tax=Clostridium lundense TaxID=319475 RepID=UPI000487D7AE|nr:helix-hairpin-helix domain-containing protein [Clostridium lundense]
MKKYIFLFITSIVLFFTIGKVSAKEIINIIVLKAGNETKDGFPVYEEGGDTKAFMEVYNKSFMKESIDLYGLAQQYSTSKNKKFYVAFKKGSGCYGSIGFYLKKDGKLYNKTKSPYIELSPDQLNNNYNRLQSITQIFPHEMGHVLYGITAGENKDIDQNTVDIHYSDIVTEYSIAFNEGFGEHFEVISRLYEENKVVKDGIYNDIERIKNSINPRINRINRDFIFPLRLDYYRETCMFCQSQYEGLKRHEFALNSHGKYKNLRHDFMNSEKSVLYRNMGLYQDKSNKRTLEQSLSTEAVNSSFFVKLITTDKGTLSERYSKVFNVFSKHINKDDKPELIQFTNGYIKEYPEDKNRVLNIFNESTGYDFTKECGREIWIVSEGKHSNVIMDQFAGLNFPMYVFNINTCEKEDLLKLKGISKSDAESIIAYRDENGYFNDVREFEKIKGITKASVEILKNSSSKEKLKKVKNELKNISRNIENKVFNIALGNFKHLILRTVEWLVIFLIFYYLIIARKTIKNKNDLFKSIAKKSFKFIFYVLLGLTSAFASNAIWIGNKNLNPIIIFMLLIFILQGIGFLIIRRNKVKLKDSFISTIMLMIIIIYSLC